VSLACYQPALRQSEPESRVSQRHTGKEIAFKVLAQVRSDNNGSKEVKHEDRSQEDWQWL